MRLGQFLSPAVPALLLGSAAVVSAQQYVGIAINNTLPTVPGSNLTYFNVKDPGGSTAKLTLTNYMSLNAAGGRVDGPLVKRAVIVIHGLDRDPYTYMSNMLSALSQVPNSDVNQNSVAICAPYFPNGNDKNVGYPWTNGLAAGAGSTSSALVWTGSQFADGANNVYPYKTKTMSSYAVLDLLIKYFDDKTAFPNLNEIVIAGHSLGAQTTQRYAGMGLQLSTVSPVTYYVANPDSFAWWALDRPLDTSTCATYDVWRAGLTNYTVECSYNAALANSGRSAVYANYMSRQIAYARGTQDFGDDSSTCAPFSQGANRGERFFNFIKRFPPVCTTNGTGSCDTIDYVNAGHDAGAMFSSSAGQARLFLDNFNGTGKMAYDFGYPRLQTGDDPYPDPVLSANQTVTPNATYAGNMTYQGCYQDVNQNTLPYLAYANNSNTIEMCTSVCNAAGYLIAGMEYGISCYCGNALAASTHLDVNAGCQVPCYGNTNETCGDSQRLSVYSNGAPTVLVTPVTPALVSSIWAYQGCYLDNNPGRTLSSKSTASSSMTLEYCASYCSGYSYFGTEYSQECYCGNALNTGGTITTSTDCSYTCSGNTTELCGAGNRLTVYFTNSTTSSTTSSSAAATSTAATIACPGSNGSLFNTTSGAQFNVECYVDRSGGDIGMGYADTYAGCLNLCASTSGCVAASWVSTANGVNNPCYMKSLIGTGNSNTGVWGGSLAVAASASSISSSSSTTATTSTSVAVTSSTTTSASSASTTLSCPGSNGQTYTGTDGQTFMVECYVDHAAGDLTMQYATTLTGCIQLCDTTTSCVAFSWVGSANGQNSPCYMKSSIGAADTNTGVWGGKWISSSAVSSTSASSSSTSTATSSATNKAVTTTTTSTTQTTSLACPGSNGATYTFADGQTFMVECAVDHAGGDLTMAYTTTLYGCIALCDSTTSCVAYSWVSSANGQNSPCYMKSSIGAANANSGVWGGKLIASAAVSSTAAASKVTSSSTSTAVASTTTTAAASTSTNLACPGSNGVTYTFADGQTFMVECSVDHAGGDLTMQYTTSLYGCISLCDSTAGCVAYSWVGSANGQTNPCYMKSSIGAANANSGVWGGKLVSSSTVSSSKTSTTTSAVTTAAAVASQTSSTSSTTTASAVTNPSSLACPGSNGATYTFADGQTFMVECSVDHAGGDLAMQYTTSLYGCISLCDATASCVAYSWVGSANGQNNPCYMKSSIGAANTNSGVWGGKLIAAASSSKSGSSTTSTTTSASASIATAATVVAQASTTTTTASTTSASSVTNPSSLACPANNGATYTMPDNSTFMVECYVDHSGGDLTMAYATSLFGCISLCDVTTSCVAFSWVGSANGQNNPCYMKSSIGLGNSNTGVWGGKMISAGTVTTSSSTTTTTTSAATVATTQTTTSAQTSSTTTSSAAATGTLPTIAVLSCPSSDTDLYTSTSGAIFQVQCYNDRTGTDLTMAYATTLTGCINTCANTAGCVAYSWVSTANGQSNPCYMKSSLGGNRSNSGVWGGILYASAAASSSSTLSSATTLSTVVASSSSTTVASSSATTTSSSTTSAVITSSSTTSSSTTTTSSSTTTTTTSSTTAALILPTGFVSGGCFADNGTTHELSYTAGPFTSTNSPSYCAQQCQSSGYKYAGTENGSGCYCGNEVQQSANGTTGCNVTCTGDSSQICGGVNTLSVSIDTNWKASTSARSTYGNWTLLSCYTDSISSRTIGTNITTTYGSTNMTEPNCLSACNAAGMAYCGVEAGNACFGSNTKPSSSLIAQSPYGSYDPYLAGCGVACSGNSTEMCGGNNRVLVFSTLST